MMTMSKTPKRHFRATLMDRDMSSSNYTQFESATVLERGAVVRFTFPCGVAFEVPVQYLITWFEGPHYIKNGNRWIDAPENAKFRRSNRGLSATAARRVRGKGAVRVYFDNLTAVDVAWDTLLMACEPAYEHFGGLTPYSRRLTLAVWKKWTKFWFGTKAG